MTRIVLVPSALALLPAYASIEDPIPELRAACRNAVSWLVADGSPVQVLGDGRIAEALGVVEERACERLGATTSLLVVANGTASRSEKAPGHLDDRSFAFDAGIETVLRSGRLGDLAGLDAGLGAELWCRDVPVLQALGRLAPQPMESIIDYADDPFGVQYWVARFTA